jgi:hypothetical protein
MLGLVVGHAARIGHAGAGEARLGRLAAAARVHRRDQLEPRRKADAVVRPRDDRLARSRSAAAAPSRTCGWNSGSSSRNSTPVMGERDLARAHPQRRRRSAPPSTRNDADYGTAAASSARRLPDRPPRSGSSRPPAARAAVSGGRIEGRRLASIDLPEPGGPFISRLWPPAAAISRARLALSWPLMSRRSASGHPPPDAATRASAGTGPACRGNGWRAEPGCPAPAPRRPRPPRPPPGRRAGQMMPSPMGVGRHGGGQHAGHRRDPAVEGELAEHDEAAERVGRNGADGRHQTERDGKIECEPSFGRSAGARLTVIRLPGSASPRRRAPSARARAPRSPPCRAGRRC